MSAPLAGSSSLSSQKTNPRNSDSIRCVRTDMTDAPRIFCDMPAVCKLGPGCVVSLDVWESVDKEWEDCFIYVGALGELCLTGTGMKRVVEPTRLGYKLASLAVSTEALFARSEDGRVFRYNAILPAQAQHAFESTPAVVEFVDAKSEIVQIAAGGRHQLALTQTGKVYAWGRNHKGQLGVRSTNTAVSAPVLVSGLDDFTITSIACGLGHCAVITSEGKLLTWGWNEFGQLGHGHTRDCSAPVLVEGLENVVQAALGACHTIARSAIGVWACGSNEAGQLGVVPYHADYDSKTPAISSVPQSSKVFLPLTCLDASRVLTVICGHYHSAALVGRHRPLAVSWGMSQKKPNYLVAANTLLDTNSMVCLFPGVFRTCTINSGDPPLLNPRVSPVLQRLLEDANDPSKFIESREITVVPREGEPVSMRLPLLLLEIRAKTSLLASFSSSSSTSSSTSASSSFPLVECSTIEGFMGFLHYFVWGTCPLTQLSVVQDILDLSLRYGVPLLATACQEFCEAEMEANSPPPLSAPEEKKITSRPSPAPLSIAPISFSSLLASIRTKQSLPPSSVSSSPSAEKRKKTPAYSTETSSIGDSLSTVDLSWNRKHAANSLAQFETDMKEFMESSKGDVEVKEWETNLTLLSIFVEAWKTEGKEGLKFVDGLSLRGFEKIKRFVYTGDTKLEHSNVKELVSMLLQASVWKLDDLEDRLVAHISTELSLSYFPATELLELTDRFNLEPLRSLAINTLSVTYDELSFTDRARFTAKQRREIQPVAHVPAGCAMM